MAPHATFFAQADRARYLFQEAFPQKGRDSAEVLNSMAIVVLAFASSIAFVYFLRRMRTGMRQSTSIQATRLFTHCLRRLDLPLTDRVLLRLAARRCALRQHGYSGRKFRRAGRGRSTAGINSWAGYWFPSSPGIRR